MAREAYEAAVIKDLLPALLDCIEDEIPFKHVVSVAKFVQRLR